MKTRFMLVLSHPKQSMKPLVRVSTEMLHLSISEEKSDEIQVDFEAINEAVLHENDSTKNEKQKINDEEGSDDSKISQKGSNDNEHSSG
jgi:hypothetical protein